MGELDGAYTLKEEVGEKPEDVCVDGCIYSRLNSTNVDDEYCFKREDSSGTLECQVNFLNIKLPPITTIFKAKIVQNYI